MVELIVAVISAYQGSGDVEGFNTRHDDAVERVAEFGAARLAQSDSNEVVVCRAVEDERVGAADTEEIDVNVVGQGRIAGKTHRRHRKGADTGNIGLVHRAHERAAAARGTVEVLDGVVADGAVHTDSVAV